MDCETLYDELKKTITDTRTLCLYQTVLRRLETELEPCNIFAKEVAVWWREEQAKKRYREEMEAAVYAYAYKKQKEEREKKDFINQMTAMS